MSNRYGSKSPSGMWLATLAVVLGAAGCLVFATGCGDEGGAGSTTVLERDAAPAPGPSTTRDPIGASTPAPDASLELDLEAWDPRGDQWAAMYLGGAKSGHSHRAVTRAEHEGTPVWVSTEDGRFELDRGGAVLAIASSARIVEDDSGKVLEFRTRMEMGGAPQIVVGKLADDRLELTRNGRTTTHAYPKGALGPIAAYRRVLEHVAAGKTSFVVPSFSGEVPDQVDRVAYEVAGVEKVDLYGRVVLGRRVGAKSSLMPMPAVRWISRTGAVLQDQVDLPFGRLVLKPCDEQTAKSKNEPAEVFLASFVVPQRAIKRPRKLDRAVYKLGMRGDGMETIYEGEGQKVLARDDGRLTLEVTWPVAPEGVKAFQLPVTVEGMQGFLEPNAFIESDDELVRSLAKEAIGEERDALKIAVLIEGYVREKIDEKNLNVGFATAAEVARSCEGDCTEHGVLCAALARAVGLPARVVTGLVYLPPMKGVAALEKTGGFGFHMWSEVYVADGYWYPIDAAIGRYDATHIALGKSDLAGASPGHNMTVETMNVMGKLTLEVIEPK